MPVSGLLRLQLHLFFLQLPFSTHGSCVPWCCIPSLAHSFFISSPLPGNFTRFLPFSLTPLSAVYSLQLPTPPKTSFLFPTPDICRCLLYAKYSSPPRGSTSLAPPALAGSLDLPSPHAVRLPASTLSLVFKEKRYSRALSLPLSFHGLYLTSVLSLFNFLPVSLNH